MWCNVLVTRCPARPHAQTQRPWGEFFLRFDIPASSDVVHRVRANYFYYEANYALLYSLSACYAMCGAALRRCSSDDAGMCVQC